MHGIENTVHSCVSIIDNQVYVNLVSQISSGVLFKIRMDIDGKISADMYKVKFTDS